MKFWKAKLKDGSWVAENDSNKEWKTIQKEVVYLELHNDAQIISLPKAEKYIQGKTASGNLITGECMIESRYVGYLLGNSIVKVRVNEQTGHISIETEAMPACQP